MHRLSMRRLGVRRVCMSSLCVSLLRMSSLRMRLLCMSGLYRCVCLCGRRRCRSSIGGRMRSRGRCAIIALRRTRIGLTFSLIGARRTLLKAQRSSLQQDLMPAYVS